MVSGGEKCHPSPAAIHFSATSPAAISSSKCLLWSSLPSSICFGRQTPRRGFSALLPARSHTPLLLLWAELRRPCDSNTRLGSRISASPVRHTQRSIPLGCTRRGRGPSSGTWCSCCCHRLQLQASSISSASAGNWPTRWSCWASWSPWMLGGALAMPQVQGSVVVLVVALVMLWIDLWEFIGVGTQSWTLSWLIYWIVGIFYLPKLASVGEWMRD